MTGCVRKQNQRRCVRRPNHRQWLGPVSEEKRNAGYNVHQSLPLLACWMHRQSNRIHVVSLCLTALMYITTAITTSVKMRLESLNRLMRFKILSMVTVKSVVLWHVMPGAVVASCHAARNHMPEDSILETNSMELNSWKAISFSLSEEISHITVHRRLVTGFAVFTLAWHFFLLWAWQILPLYFFTIHFKCVRVCT